MGDRTSEWTLARIHSELRRRAVAGEDLGYEATERRGGGLVAAAKAHCGSWAAALEGACERYPQVATLRAAYDAALQGAGARVSRPAVGAGTWVREARLARGWSQAELARRTTDVAVAAGLDIEDRQSDVSNWERGRYAVPPRVAEALAVAPPSVVTAPQTGRPPQIALADMTAREVATAVHGREPTPSESRAIGYALAGTTDLGVERLDRLLDARPDLDARAIVKVLADRIRARRQPAAPAPGPRAAS